MSDDRAARGEGGFGRSVAPDALDDFAGIHAWLAGRRPALFLDFDGTLAPIVDDPDAARLPDPVHACLRACARHFRVAIVSGRELDDVTRRVDLPELVCAGCHGFDIAGPGGLRFQHAGGRRHLPALNRAERRLGAEIGSVPGLRLERKRFSLAVHYRGCADAQTARIADAAARTARQYGLRLCEGSKLLELQPPVAWDKGRAVLWLMRALQVDPRRTPPLYIGDDRTDEDVFRVLAGEGLGIRVGPPLPGSAARYRLADPGAVAGFIGRLLAGVSSADG